MGAVLLCWIGDASAHRPYFTEHEPIVLPDGQPGEMRVLNGDGIIFADPARFLVLDRDSRLLARSSKGGPMTIVCRGQRMACFGYDHQTFRVLVPDPGSFRRDGPLVPGIGERDGLWELEDGEDHWGFASRAPSPFEFLVAEAEHVGRHFYALLVVAGIGLVLGVISIAPSKIPSHNSIVRIVWSIVLVTVKLLVSLALGLFASYVMLLIGLSFASWLGSLALGTAIPIATKIIWISKAGAPRQVVPRCGPP